jgi:hypothetical protein
MMSDLTTWTADELLQAKHDTAERATDLLFAGRWRDLPALEIAARRFGAELALRHGVVQTGG